MKKGSKEASIFTVVVLVIVAIMIGASLIQGISYKADDEGFKVAGGLFYKTSVKYSDIQDVELLDFVNYGSRTNGMGGININAGHFSNSDFGSYMLYVYKNTGKFIKVTYTENNETKVIVFNFKDVQTTESTADEIRSK